MIKNHIRLLTCIGWAIAAAAMFIRPTHAVEDIPTTTAGLTEMVDAMALEMKRDYPGRILYLDREDMRSEQDGGVFPFSGMLVNELERALSRNGFGFEGRVIDRADYSLGASYRLSGDSVTVYLKVRDMRSGSAYRNLKGNFRIARERLPADSFNDSLDNRVSRLATKVGRGWLRAAELSVFVPPVVEARKRYSSPFSEYVTRKVKTVLPNERVLRVIEEKPAMQKLIRTRSVSTDRATIQTGDAAVAGADAVLEGSYLRSSDAVSLVLTLKDLKGAVIASAEDTIPLRLIQFSTRNDDAETLASIADTEHESGGDTVRISTVKGGAYQVFHEGESVCFRLQVARPLYLYVYDINPQGDVNLLYPKPGEPESPRLPGIIHMLPEDNDSWVIKVEPPFGTDAVKVFASNQRLPLPKISSRVASRSFEGSTRSLKRVDQIQKALALQPEINGRDLVDYYKGLAASSKSLLFESTVYIETRAR